MKKTIITFVTLLAITLIPVNKIASQVGMGSEVFGESPIAPNGLNSSMIENTWGVKPSEQGTLSDIGNTNNLDDVDTNTNIEGEVSSESSEGPPPPPEDPEDIPLDGGTSILLALAAGVEYKRRKKLSKHNHTQQPL
ncbi:MAG: hypothetical protein KF781_04010 [Chitinophagaceae bacterium]|nr:hypothetical protein [Chitinophagaceae bacterium]MCW5904749.1 hypothetical protein [Chitinophagaceae bacterium]